MLVNSNSVGLYKNVVYFLSIEIDCGNVVENCDSNKVRVGCVKFVKFVVNQKYRLPYRLCLISKKNFCKAETRTNNKK